MSASLLNAFFLRSSYTKMYFRSITMSFHCIASTSIRSLSLSSFLSSESRSNAVTELVEVPSIDYAESQKKYSSARIELITRSISGASTGSATDIDSPHHRLSRLFGHRPHEVWRRLGIVQTSLTLLSACTNFHRLVDSPSRSDCKYFSSRSIPSLMFSSELAYEKRTNPSPPVPKSTPGVMPTWAFSSTSNAN